MSKKRFYSAARQAEKLQKDIETLRAQREELLKHVSKVGAYDKKCRLWEEVNQIQVRINKSNGKLRRLQIAMGADPKPRLF